VQQLVTEGYDVFLARRALAFSGMTMDDARAILLADKLDEEEEMRTIAISAASEKESEQEMETVAVDANFDPAPIGVESPAAAPASSTQRAQRQQLPATAKKEDVVFEATTAQIQKLVIESPVPVLLDMHAEW